MPAKALSRAAIAKLLEKRRRSFPQRVEAHARSVLLQREIRQRMVQHLREAEQHHIGQNMSPLGMHDEAQVVMRSVGIRPKDLRVFVELEDAVDFPDPDDIAVWEKLCVTPPVLLGRRALRSIGMVRPDLAELGSPLMNNLAFHIHQESRWRVAGSEEAVSLLCERLVVDRDSLMRAGRGRP